MRRRFSPAFACASSGEGMTLLELLVAVLMLVVFTGVVVMVMEFTYRFFGESDPGNKAIKDRIENGQCKPDDYECMPRQGVLIEHQEIQLIFDELVLVLAQPGAKARVDKISSLRQKNPTAKCVPPGRDIADFWQLDGMAPGKILPYGYSLCLWETTVQESITNAGIFQLQALPEQISASKLPTRRLFCRPRPFC